MSWPDDSSFGRPRRPLRIARLSWALYELASRRKYTMTATCSYSIIWSRRSWTRCRMARYAQLTNKHGYISSIKNCLLRIVLVENKENGLAQKILKDAEIVICTLNLCGGSMMDCLARKKLSLFDAIIIDEVVFWSLIIYVTNCILTRWINNIVVLIADYVRKG